MTQLNGTHAFAPLQNDRLLRAARGQQVDRPPMWVMRQAGRYLPEYHEEKANNDFFVCCRNPEIASNLTLQPIDRYAGLVDAAIIFSDILVIPQAMGMTVVMEDKVGPRFPEPMRTPNDHQYREMLDRKVDVAKELDYVYKAITLTRQKLDGRVPLIGFCGAPWTLLCYMIEGGGTKIFQFVKRWIHGFPEEAKKMMQKIAEVCVEYLVLQVKAGAQMLQVFDSWAGELSKADFLEFSLPQLRFISRETKRRLKAEELDVVPITVFAKGANSSIAELCESQYEVVGLDWEVDPVEAVKIARGRVALQGNSDPGMLYGSHEGITRVVKQQVADFKGSSWVVNLGHGITPGVNPDNLRHFFEEMVKYAS